MLAMWTWPNGEYVLFQDIHLVIELELQLDVISYTY